MSPLGRSMASWLKSVIGGCPIAASSALTASMFVSRRVSPARSISRSVSQLPRPATGVPPSRSTVPPGTRFVAIAR